MECPCLLFKFCKEFQVSKPTQRTAKKQTFIRPIINRIELIYKIYELNESVLSDLVTLWIRCILRIITEDLKQN